MFRHTAITLSVILAFLPGASAVSSGFDTEVRITQFIDPIERRKTIAALETRERFRTCRRVIKTPIFEVLATIEGEIRRPHSNTQSAGVIILEAVEAWYFGSTSAGEHLLKALEEGSRIQAFTEMEPYSPTEYKNYNPMNEPVFYAANFLLALAHAYVIVKEVYPGEKQLLAAVRKWGDRLHEISSNSTDDFIGRSKGVDRRVLIAQGWAHWGNVTENRQILSDAYRYYVAGMETIGRNGEDRIWGDIFPELRTYYSNLTYGAAMAAAFVLVRSGADDVYSMAPGGGTLVEGMSWLWDRMVQEQPADLLRARHTGSRAVAWTELFVHEFPQHAASRKMESWLEGNPVPRFSYTGGGGPTTCLYRGDFSERVHDYKSPPNEVYEMQQALIRHCQGLSEGFADGAFGPGTRAALKRFQESRGLTPDGVLGPQTAAALSSPPDGSCK